MVLTWICTSRLATKIGSGRLTQVPNTAPTLALNAGLERQLTQWTASCKGMKLVRWAARGRGSSILVDTPSSGSLVLAILILHRPWHCRAAPYLPTRSDRSSWPPAWPLSPSPSFSFRPFQPLRAVCRSFPLGDLRSFWPCLFDTAPRYKTQQARSLSSSSFLRAVLPPH
jgi:hypothetical protein